MMRLWDIVVGLTILGIVAFVLYKAANDPNAPFNSVVTIGAVFTYAGVRLLMQR
jgi:hypothetical protein